MKIKSLIVLILLSLTYYGCVALNKETTASSIQEAQWIRNGESIIFEGEEWRPKDIIENLLDDEVL